LSILYEIKIIIVNGAYAVFSGISYGIFQPWLQGFRSKSTSEYRTLVMIKLGRKKVFIEEDHIGLYIKKTEGYFPMAERFKFQGHHFILTQHNLTS
jgi:hypothetical protein